MDHYKYKDYTEYSRIQIVGNALKIKLVFVSVQTVKAMCKYLKNHKPIKGLCHGARNGTEVKWFNKYLKDCKTYGTDISGTAVMFKNMIVHDMNKEHKSWLNKFNFVYSNSWDHSFDIESTLKVWKGQVKKKGFLLLETSHKHEKFVNELDPCRMNIEELKEVVSKNTKMKYKKSIETEKGLVLIWQKI